MGNSTVEYKMVAFHAKTYGHRTTYHDPGEDIAVFLLTFAEKLDGIPASRNGIGLRGGSKRNM